MKKRFSLAVAQLVMLAAAGTTVGAQQHYAGGETRWFNLQGQPVDPDSNANGILISSDGTKIIR